MYNVHTMYKMYIIHFGYLNIRLHDTFEYICNQIVQTHWSLLNSTTVEQWVDED